MKSCSKEGCTKKIGAMDCVNPIIIKNGLKNTRITKRKDIGKTMTQFWQKNMNIEEKISKNLRNIIESIIGFISRHIKRKIGRAHV